MNASLESQAESQKANWQSNPGIDAAWDARRLVSECSKAGNNDLAIEHGEAALAIWPAFEPLASAVGWAYYRRDLADIAEESSLDRRRVAKKAIDRIRQLSAAKPYDTYSPWPRAVLKFSAALVKQWPKAALELLDQLEPGKLSSQRDGEFAPERERWYMQFTKALEGSEQWTRLLDACDSALSEDCIERSNQRWIRLRRAEALRSLGRGEEAERVVGSEAMAGGEPWLYARWAKLLAELSLPEDSLKAAYRALLSGGANSFGWETLALVGELLESDDPELAADHVRLSRMIRKAEQWPAKLSLETLANRLGIDDEEVGPGVDELKRKLMKTWRRVEDDEREAGTVTKHINEGAGFITPDFGGEPLFFSRPKDSNKPLPSVGDRVSYIRQKSFDKKKNREAERAGKWRLIQS